MRRGFTYITFLLFLFIYSVSYAQDRIENTLLIQFKDNYSPNRDLAALKTYFSLSRSVQYTEITCEPLNIWKLNLSDDRTNSEEIIKYLSQNKNVINIDYDRKVEFRELPDDTDFNRQWSLYNTGQSGGMNDADIDAELAWDLTTGGVNSNGDTIVICVIDGGIDKNHEDLADNMWVNHNEIQDNGIDDDNNGYIDDYFGWNASSKNDKISGNNHGTKCAGIIGAKGNNAKGITGINWNVKLMNVQMGGTVSEIIEAYSYVYTQRKIYNETNGEKGAFVVATNSSFGLNNAKSEEFPIWCSMYDKLGEVGVISIVATCNANTDVDVDGDMPSTCSSPYMISVTNMDMHNKKYGGAGYGKINVDLGAYGDGTYSTGTNNSYLGFSGTSAATPHVTGIVGLLYSYSNKLAEISLAYPVQSVLIVKDALLNGVVHNSSLVGITSTEGVVNAYNSILELDKYESGCTPPTKIGIDPGDLGTLQVYWDDYDADYKYDLRYWTDDNDTILLQDVISPLQIDAMPYCKHVYLQIRKYCGDNYGEYGFTYNLLTEGCCTTPEIQDYSVNGNLLSIMWNDVRAATDFALQYKYWSSQDWNEIIIDTNFVEIDYNYDCGKMLYQIRTNCEYATSEFTNIKTIGDECDSCNILEYCHPIIDNNYEYIDSISISDFNFKSGADILGYGKHHHTPSFTLEKGKKYPLNLKVGFKSQVYEEFLFVWIDFNRDGIFSEDELILNNKSDSGVFSNDTIMIPDSMPQGYSRMRIMIGYQDNGNPCVQGENSYGEIEDYCFFIDKRSSSKDELESQALKVYPNPASKSITISAQNNKLTELELLNAIGEVIEVINIKDKTTIDISKYKTGIYFLRDKKGLIKTKKLTFVNE